MIRYAFLFDDLNLDGSIKLSPDPSYKNIKIKSFGGYVSPLKLGISILRCNPDQTCKSEQDLTQFLKDFRIQFSHPFSYNVLSMDTDHFQPVQTESQIDLLVDQERPLAHKMELTLFKDIDT